jgi:chaperonin cofactor prefoldin
MNEHEIQIDELSKWKEALETNLEELSNKMKKVEEQFIRQKIHFEIYNGMEGKKNETNQLYDSLGTLKFEKESLEKETFEKQEEIWTLITHINMKLVALGVVL